MAEIPGADPIEPLTGPERRLVAAAKAGTILALDKDETIRAVVVQTLACGEREDWPVAPEGVRLRGGRIAGRLDCTERVLDHPLWLDDTDIPDGVYLINAQARTLSFDDSRVDGIRAQNVRIEGMLCLRKSRLKGMCDISSAMIAGQFLADGATFDNPNGQAINAHSASMAGVFLDNAMLKGVCNFNGATIAGQFSANDATFDNPGGDAINAQSASMDGLFIYNATVKGVCDVNSATITGPFAAGGATFDNASGFAINAESSRVGEVFLRTTTADPPKPVTINGTVNFQAATIERHFEVSGARLAGGSLGAFRAGHAEARGLFLLGAGTQIEGAVVLSGAEIRGCLDLSGSQLVSYAAASNPATRRIADDQLWFTALDLSEAEVSQIIMPDPASRRYPGGTRPRGIVDLSRARVGTLTDFAAGWPEPATLRGRTCPGRLRDKDGRDADHLVLDGFEYQHLDNPDGNAMDGEYAHVARLRWLRAQSCDDLFTRLRPQPWRHLASVLAAQGYEDEARRIAIERRVAQRYASGTGLFPRAVSWLLHLLADYGFNPWKAMAWSGGVIALCALLYGMAAATYCTSAVPRCADGTVFVRTTAADFVPGISDVTEAEKKLAESYPAFDPVAYSFDVFLPFFDVGTERFWRVNTTTWWGMALYYFTVLEQIAGALLISLIVTGFTGLLTRAEG